MMNEEESRIFRIDVISLCVRNNNNYTASSQTLLKIAEFFIFPFDLITPSQTSPFASYDGL